MQNKPIIRTEDLTVFYAKNKVLKGLNLKIPRQKITVIIGPSGCGKSTLLKAFNRLLELNDEVKIEGKIFLDDKDIFSPNCKITELRRKVGLLAQRPCVLPTSIYENVAFVPRLDGIKNKAELNQLVTYHLKEVGLWTEVVGRLHTPASRLSVGQQQRLCLARGLAAEPLVILGDEPTSALDPRSAKKIEEKFNVLKQNYTIVLVTHILRQARRLADYVIFLYEGQVIEEGEVDEFFENPKEEITKEYLAGIFS